MRLLSFQVVAELFAVDVRVLREACAYGLLHERVSDDQRGLSSEELDRVARLVALHVHYGLDWDVIVVVFDEW